MAVDGRLHVDLARPLERADEEGVDSDETSRLFGLDMALAELWREAFEQLDLFVGEDDLALGCLFLQAQQTLVLGQQAVALPDAAHPPPDETARPLSLSSCSTLSAPWQG